MFKEIISKFEIWSRNPVKKMYMKYEKIYKWTDF